MNFYSSNFVGWDILNGSPCNMCSIFQWSSKGIKNVNSIISVPSRIVKEVYAIVFTMPWTHYLGMYWVKVRCRSYLGKGVDGSRSPSWPHGWIWRFFHKRRKVSSQKFPGDLVVELGRYFTREKNFQVKKSLVTSLLNWEGSKSKSPSWTHYWIWKVFHKTEKFTSQTVPRDLIAEFGRVFRKREKFQNTHTVGKLCLNYS